MKKCKNILCTSVLLTTLIIPTTSFASDNLYINEQNGVHTVINQFFSFFQWNKESALKNSEVSIYHFNQESFSTFFIGDTKFTSKEMEKYHNRYRYEDKDDDDGKYSSKDIWKKWYCKDGWDWWKTL